MVNFHFGALANADLSQPAHVEDSSYQFKSPDIGAYERRAMHERWILAKAFQELLRAVRHHDLNVGAAKVVRDPVRDPLEITAATQPYGGNAPQPNPPTAAVSP